MDGEAKIAHFIPGRIRIISPLVHNNPTNVALVKSYLNNLKEIKNFSVNQHTGSIVLEYSPEDIAQGSLLSEIEGIIAKNYTGGSS